MDSKCFRYFIEVYECGSINKAAKHLGLSQPNLSVCIKNAEKELGFSVFSRNNNRIQLTSEGELFLKSARKIVRELDAIGNIPSLFANKGNISVSSTYSFDFMNLFMQFKKKNPARNIEDSFKETGLIQVIRDVMDKRYRMVLFYCFDSISESYFEMAEKYNMKLIPIVKSKPLILLTSKKNPLALRKKIEFERIRELRCIMYENFKFEEWLGILGFEDDNKILYVFDRGGLLDAIKQSNYSTVMMKRFSDVSYSSECVEIPVVNAPCGMSAYLMYHSAYVPNPREKIFIRQLKALFND